MFCIWFKCCIQSLWHYRVPPQVVHLHWHCTVTPLSIHSFIFEQYVFYIRLVFQLFGYCEKCCYELLVHISWCTCDNTFQLDTYSKLLSPRVSIASTLENKIKLFSSRKQFNAYTHQMQMRDLVLYFPQHFVLIIFLILTILDVYMSKLIVGLICMS